ncbi:hypothetical protein L249_2552 [Ophiocordyceps polyrhachis-furcata BCC 54312]|uniref:D-serine dehydratase-like domain-containing protein n=1 Tax=Ophiocordyceps polyrhachis-furcata BCC 54312 TaxID=1330021 RepID=A0A367LQM0_9HYPO|nr:hypothetical protein L249_2552 [Ophiocordyceps polyrhachis-furcata BCC 54312]
MASSSSSSSSSFFPPSPRDALIATYVGRPTSDVPAPAAILDVAVVRRNCDRMLQACADLGLRWRAHVKTHKVSKSQQTVEVMRLQVGSRGPVNLIVSTMAEAEFLLPSLLEFRPRPVNVLYGLPLARGAVPRLCAICRALGPRSVSVLVDDPAQLPLAEELGRDCASPALVWIKIDMGGRRAGVTVDGSPRFRELAGAVLESHRRRRIVLYGLYSHAGHSYGEGGDGGGKTMLRAELDALVVGAAALRDRAKTGAGHGGGGGQDLPLTLSVGASPTALAARDLFEGEGGGGGGLVQTVTAHGRGLLTVELHAGVYPLLDLQQMAARSSLGWRDLALTVLADVHAVYPGRGARASDEALIGAGTLALGREPCKDYEGWGFVVPPSLKHCGDDVAGFRGWIVGRISQEHGILTRRGDVVVAGGDEEETEGRTPVTGSRVRIWPNHACIASSHFGWYYVVDGDHDGDGDVVVDIWVRGRGW